MKVLGITGSLRRGSNTQFTWSTAWPSWPPTASKPSWSPQGQEDQPLLGLLRLRGAEEVRPAGCDFAELHGPMEQADGIVLARRVSLSVVPQMMSSWPGPPSWPTERQVPGRQGGRSHHRGPRAGHKPGLLPAVAVVLHQRHHRAWLHHWTVGVAGTGGATTRARTRRASCTWQLRRQPGPGDGQTFGLARRGELKRAGNRILAHQARGDRAGPGSGGGRRPPSELPQAQPRVNHLARALQAQGLAHGDRLAMLPTTAWSSSK